MGQIKMKPMFRMSGLNGEGYRYVEIGDVKLAFHGLNLVAFTAPGGGLKLAASWAFDARMEEAATFEELQNRAMLAIASNSHEIFQRIMDARLTGKK